MWEFVACKTKKVIFFVNLCEFLLTKCGVMLYSIYASVTFNDSGAGSGGLDYEL